ncbi:hyaluronan and proteoglycan link protein 1-like [Lineus longissimus]|uniref:hyaluronan and proteoglycan link protein 1-like n=1 Tax=Lineus longissimus TaxID=88925 RepID=UPI002B4E64B8
MKRLHWGLIVTLALVWMASIASNAVSVVRVVDNAGYYQIANWDKAVDICASRGMRLARRDQLTEAWKQGLDSCWCGWLADGTVGYPIQKSRSGCGGGLNAPRIVTCSLTPGNGIGFDAYCTASEISVVRVVDNAGYYQIANWDKAVDICAGRGMRLARRDQLTEAWKQGLDSCWCGWLADGTVGYPIQKPRSGCNNGGQPEVVTCSLTPYNGKGWDAYCMPV